MALSISTLTALRNLSIAENERLKSSERLSTGLRLNRTSDDPVMVNLSSRLNSQILKLGKSIENASTSTNMLQTAEAALNELSEILTRIRSTVVNALNATDQTAKEALQESIDGNISAINRIAATTRFNGVSLLDGNAGFAVSGVPSNGLLQVNPFSVRLNPVQSTTTFRLRVTQLATQARAIAGSTTAMTAISASGGDVQLRIVGPLGSTTINLPDGTTVSQFQVAVNANRGLTGVYASGGFLLSDKYGSNISIHIQQTGGTGIFTGGNASAPGLAGVGSSYLSRGSNGAIEFMGQVISGVGNSISVSLPAFSGNITLNPPANQQTPGSGVTGNFQFTIVRGGLSLQIGTEAGSMSDSITVGLPNSRTSFLGREPFTIFGTQFGGFLDSIQRGNANDLFTNPQRALEIAEIAAEHLSEFRGRLGSFISTSIEPIQDANIKQEEELKKTNSLIRDTDFAEEASRLTRNEIMLQSVMAVMAQSNQLDQLMLELLR